MPTPKTGPTNSHKINQIEFSDHSATSEGWHVQWETVPPG